MYKGACNWYIENCYYYYGVIFLGYLVICSERLVEQLLLFSAVASLHYR